MDVLKWICHKSSISAATLSQDSGRHRYHFRRLRKYSKFWPEPRSATLQNLHCNQPKLEVRGTRVCDKSSLSDVNAKLKQASFRSAVGSRGEENMRPRE